MLGNEQGGCLIEQPATGARHLFRFGSLTLAKSPKDFPDEAILLGSEITASAPCLEDVLSVSFFLLITVWVTPESQLAELTLRGSSVLTQDFRDPQMAVRQEASRLGLKRRA